jgi:hypothetical protein
MIEVLDLPPGDVGPYVGVDMYASIEQKAPWQLAQFGLDVLGTMLSDERPFSGMKLERPMEFGPDVLLRLRVGVPASMLDDLCPRLEGLLTDVVREIVGPDVRAACVAGPDDGGKEAVG